jgi:hypothetical protein
LQDETLAFDVKGNRPIKTTIPPHMAMARTLLESLAKTSFIIMLLACFFPSYGARLTHGGVGGANRAGHHRRPAQRFAPALDSTDTARPARP